MPTSVLNQWIDRRPSRVVVGTGIYARAFAQVIKGDIIDLETLAQEPPRLKSGSHPTVLDDFELLFVVVGDIWCVADVVHQVDQLSSWVQELSSAAEFHEFAIVFIIGPGKTVRFEASLANALGFEAFQPKSGVMAWRLSDSLGLLTRELKRVHRIDFQTLRTRRAGQPKYQALSNLKSAIANDNATNILKAAHGVAAAFQNDNHALDSFCGPPYHANGNAWRLWIARIVTEGVTPELCARARELSPTLNV